MDSRIHTRFPCWIAASIAGLGRVGGMNCRIHRAARPGGRDELPHPSRGSASRGGLRGRAGCGGAGAAGGRRDQSGWDKDASASSALAGREDSSLSRLARSTTSIANRESGSFS